MTEFGTTLFRALAIWVCFITVAAEGHLMQNLTSRTFFGNGLLRCGGSSRLEQINMKSANPPPESCSYQIRANALRVCQLRIDFDTKLAPPRASSTSLQYAHCADDAITIDDHRIELCGHNVGQHIYVPWNVNSLRETRRIRVRIANRQLNPTLPAPTWSIRVTQIACRGPIVAREHPLRAPNGCDQFFTWPEGHVSSFNYNEGNGPYPGNLQYSICFQRQPHHAALRINPVSFEMSKHLATGPGYDTDCVPQVDTAGASVDYLAIAGARFSNDLGVATSVNRFCGTGMVPGQVVTVQTPGPFMLYFSSDDQTTMDERGFKLQYTLI